MICRFCSGLNTFSIRWTSINGIAVLLYADLAHARTLATVCTSRQSRLSESHDLVSTCPLDTRDMCLADA
jgi:hypothetical protein